MTWTRNLLNAVFAIRGVLLARINRVYRDLAVHCNGIDPSPGPLTPILQANTINIYIPNPPNMVGIDYNSCMGGCNAGGEETALLLSS